MNQLACTQKQASKILGVSISTIGIYIKKGLIKSTKIGTRTLINISSIYELLDEEEVTNIDIIKEYYKIFSNMTGEEKVKEISKLVKLSMEGGMY